MHDQPAYMVMGGTIEIKCWIEMVTKEDECELIKNFFAKKELNLYPVYSTIYLSSNC